MATRTDTQFPAIKPRLEGGVAFEPGQRPERLEVGLLQRVVHRLPVSEQAVGETSEPPVVGADERMERVRIASGRPDHERALVVCDNRCVRHGDGLPFNRELLSLRPR